MATTEDDPLIPLMRKAGIQVTRENYIDLAWGRTPPEPWTAEHEAELPEELQDFRDLRPSQ